LVRDISKSSNVSFSNPHKSVVPSTTGIGGAITVIVNGNLEILSQPVILSVA
jgi:hypothetical protein